MQVKKQQLESNIEQWTGSKLGKEYVKAVYCHPAYLTYMQNTSCEMLVWMTQKLASRLPGDVKDDQGKFNALSKVLKASAQGQPRVMEWEGR